MFFDLDEDERALQEGIRDLLAGRVTMDVVRAAADTDGVDRLLWAELADAGVFALRLPEAEGGLGLGMTHATVVFEELGRCLVPGPLVATHAAARLIEGVATGDRIVTAVAGGSGVIAHLAAADDLVVTRPEVLRIARPDDVVGVAATRPLDPLTPVHHVPDLPTGQPLGEQAAAPAWQREAAVLTAAQLLGLALRATDMAVAYAKQREQFGKPIGAFQAVKHLCADMLTRAEVARAAVYSAAVHLDDPDLGGVDRAVDAAVVLAAEAAQRNGKACIQVHGGMGFTWEVDAHLVLKRAMALSASIGANDERLDALAATA